MKTRTHFKHNVFMLDEAGAIYWNISAERKTTCSPQSFTKSR
jgi:hypothetical protein